jgi:hypothetical protein
MAQAAGTWHGYSHFVLRAVAQDQDSQSPQADQCELCLAAADVSSGALLHVPCSLSGPAARHTLPRHWAYSVWHAQPALAYLSRAPPATPL